MTDPSSSSSSTGIIGLLSTLAFNHSSALPLLQIHKPLSRPSQLNQKTYNTYLNRLNAIILSRDESTGERRSSWEIAKCIVEQDEEGTVILGWGKGWIGVCTGILSSLQTTNKSLIGPLKLLTSLIMVSPQYPSFERDAVHPVTGKLAVSLTKLVERLTTESSPDYSILFELFDSLTHLIPHIPAAFRPLTPSLRSHILRIIISTETPHDLKITAADVIARLHLTSGKAQAGGAWSSEMRECIAGFGMGLGGVIADGWEEDVMGVKMPSSGTGVLPSDSGMRLPVSLEMVEGWTEVILALLRYPTARPVPIPIASLIAMSLRCLNITHDTPTVSYITPQYHAALLATLPRLWTAGMLILSGTAIACGDHIFPHLSNILDHTVYLLENVSQSMTEIQIQLIRLHNLLLSLYPPELLPLEYPTRLLKLSLTRVGSLLDSKPDTGVISNINSNGGGGKRAKKRQRGQEDGLVGGLEGREARAMREAHGEVVLEYLKLIPLLHPTPLLSPSLLTFSIRLHLSIHLNLPNIPYTAFSNPSHHASLSAAVEEVLSKALTMGNEGGSSRGYKAVLLAVLRPKGEFETFLYPSVPPLVRPNPPLSGLHYFKPEGEDERKLRVELGFSTAGEVDTQIPLDDGGMVVDDQEDPIVKSRKLNSAQPQPVPKILPSMPAQPESSIPLHPPPKLNRLHSLHLGNGASSAILVSPVGGAMAGKQGGGALARAAQDEVPAMELSQIKGNDTAEWMEVGKGKGKEVVGVGRDDLGISDGSGLAGVQGNEDEEILELDSGSSDLGSEDEVDEAEEEET